MLPVAAGLLAGGMLGSAAINAFGGGGSVEQKPMLTDQQKSAQQALLNFGNTGVTPWGYDFTQGYGGPLGNYSMTPLTQQGQNALSASLTQGMPAVFNTGTGYLSNFLNTPFDPNAGGAYSGLTAGIDTNTQKAIDAQKNQAAWGGNLFSSQNARAIGDINTNAANTKSNILANLYLQNQQQKLSAAGQAVTAGTAENQGQLAQIAASQSYGQLAQQLQDAQAKDAYSAWLTQRQAMLQPLAALTNTAGQNANYGVTSVPVASPWNNLLNTMSSTGAYLLGQGYGMSPNNETLDMTKWQNQYQWGK